MAKTRQPLARTGSATHRVPTGWLLVGLVALVAVVYANALQNPFIYDDTLTVANNPSLRWPLSLAVLKYQLFRPLVNLSYWIDFALAGPTPWLFHATSIGLHALNAVWVFFVARALLRDAGVELGRAWKLATVCAALFASDPLLSEGVSYVSARSEPLCCAFLLPSFLCFRKRIQGGSWHWQISGTLLWLGALASKEVAAALPPALLLYDILFLKQERKARFTTLHLPLFGIIVLGAVARLWIFFRFEQRPRLGVFSSLAQQCGVMFAYVGLFFRPDRQSVIHSVENVTTWWSWFSVAVFTWFGILLLLLQFRSRLPTLAWGVFWFVLCLLPSSVIPLNEPMAEHRVYIASVGLWVGGVSLLEKVNDGWLSRVPGWTRWSLLVLSVAVLGTFTIGRNRIWSSELTLWGDAVQKAPRVWAARYAHGDALRLAGHLEEAASEYQAATLLVPGEPRAYNNLGITLAQLGRLNEAGQALRRSLELDPGQPGTERNLARLNQLLESSKASPLVRP